MGKEPAALYSVPGLSLFSDTGSVQGTRGMFASLTGRAYTVIGNNVYQLQSDGTSAVVGTLFSATGLLTFAESLNDLLICDGFDLYRLSYTDGNFQLITNLLPFSSGAGCVEFIDGYFFVNQLTTRRAYYSEINDPESWDALDFVSAESSPDLLTAIKNAAGNLWLFGSGSLELWTNTGDATFPWQRISGGAIKTGAPSPHSITEIDGAVYFIGQDEKGDGIVYGATGINPTRISAGPIEREIQNASDIMNIKGYSYQEDGHTFYVLTGGGLRTTLVYDLSTQLWHERVQVAENGSFQNQIAIDCIFAFGKHLAGDRRSGKVYEQSLDFNDNAGDPILRERVYTHLFDEERRIRYNALEIGIETGTGTIDGREPQLLLSVSRDGGRTYGDWQAVGFGKLGEYVKKVAFRRLGIARQMTFRIRITDAVKVAICGSYVK
jgi:hypothetical protein